MVCRCPVLLNTMAAATSGETFAFPPIHEFAPFYTLQPNSQTAETQVDMWARLVLSFCAAHRRFQLDVRGDGDLFSNRTIDRALAPETIRIIFARLVDWGRAAYEPPVPRGARVPRVGSVETSRATHAQSAAVALTAPATVDTPGSSILVYWRTPDEWADELYSWLCNTGQNRSVLTMYELLHSRFVEDEHLPPMMLKRALQALVAKKRAQIFGGTEGVHDENLGVKFV